MASFIASSIQSWRERRDHERLETSPSLDEQDRDARVEEGADNTAEDISPSSSPTENTDETTTLTGQPRQNRRRSGLVTTGSGDAGDNNTGSNRSSRRSSRSSASGQRRSSRRSSASSTVVTVPTGSADDANGAGTENDGSPDNETEGASSGGRPTRAQLEAERVRMQQRANLCVMSAVFLLFFLWVQAIGSGDFGLLLVCLIGTNWTARFMRHQRERDEEFERFLATYDENAPVGGESGTTIYGHDIQTLSFQAQVALAIMESQRQMMEGGYGHPDGISGGRGVSDAAKERWTKFEYKPEEHSAKEEDTDALKKPADDDLPHCSICLGEYEAGEACVRLPCGHIFHQDCLDSWTANHSRCPLCNSDLMAGANDE